jgi:hypothetical protein
MGRFALIAATVLVVLVPFVGTFCELAQPGRALAPECLDRAGSEHATPALRYDRLPAAPEPCRTRVQAKERPWRSRSSSS